jgi:hypothetical protein
MGFENPQVITQNSTGFEFLPVESNPGQVVKLRTPNMGDEEYFLVEYRDQVGYDAHLPGDGLLVWHVDEAKWNRWGLNQVECGSEELPCCACEGEHSLLSLEQVDGDFDLEYHTNSGDAGDLFRLRTLPLTSRAPRKRLVLADVCPEDSCIGLRTLLPRGIIPLTHVICQAPGACVNILTDRMLGWGETGDSATYEASIQNCGNADDTLTITSESAWLADFFDLGSGEPITSTSVEVPAGGTWALGITVTVPTDALWSRGRCSA